MSVSEALMREKLYLPSDSRLMSYLIGFAVQHPHISQKARDMGHPDFFDPPNYLLVATGSRTPIAGTVRPTTAAIWRTWSINVSN